MANFAMLRGAGWVGGFGILPVPRQQRVQLVPFGLSRDDAFAARRSARPADRHRSASRTGSASRRWPSAGPAVGAGEQCVLAPERHRPHGPLDGVGVQLQAPILEKQDQAVPVVQRIADRLGQVDRPEMRFSCSVSQVCIASTRRSAALLSDRLAVRGRRAADVGLDLIESGDPPQSLLGQRRPGGDMDVVELAAHMGPTEGELRRIVGLAVDQAAEPGIAIDLQQAAEAAQMCCGCSPLRSSL